MPLPIVFEAQDSRDDLTYGVNGGSITLRYNAVGSDLESDVFDAVLLVAPAAYLGFIRQDITPKRTGPNVYKVDVKYGTVGQGGSDQPAGQDPGPTHAPGGGGGDETVPLGAGWNFDSTGQPIHITQSLKTISSTAAGGGVAPNFKGAIGVSDGRIEGCDIFGGKLDWSRTVSRTTVTLEYIKKLVKLTGRTNCADFYTFGMRDVLFLGASGQVTDNNKWSITYKFSSIITETDIKICDGLIVPQKRGWEYLWVKYKNDVLEGEVGPAPLAAYVEQVIKDGDFSILELDT